MKEYGKDNDLILRIRKSLYFKPIHDKLDELMNPRTFIGRAPEQVVRFVEKEVDVELTKHVASLFQKVDISV